MNNKELPPHEDFHLELRICNPLETGYFDNEKLISNGLKLESAVAKMRLFEKRPNGAEDFFTCKMCESKKKGSCAETLCRYNSENIVPLLEAMPQMVRFFHNKVSLCSSFDTFHLIQPTFVCTVLQVQNFILSRDVKIFCYQIIVKIWLEGCQ